MKEMTNAECRVANVEEVKPISGSAAIQIGWTALIEAFTNHWQDAAMSATEIQVYVGESAHEFLKVGWLREERRASGSLFWPAGALAEYLARDVEADPLKLEDEAGSKLETRNSELHISTVPIPHIVPTPTGTGPARAPELEASPSSNGAASAVAAPFPDGRWDVRPGRASALQADLEKMIGVMRIVSDETRRKLTEIVSAQDLAGWPDWRTVDQGLSGLFRLTTELDTALMELTGRVDSCRPALKQLNQRRA